MHNLLLYPDSHGIFFYDFNATNESWRLNFGSILTTVNNLLYLVQQLPGVLSA